MKKLLIISLIVTLSLDGFAEGTFRTRKTWQFNSINGAINLGTGYRSLTGTTNGIYNYQRGTRYFGGVELGTSGSVYHPDFLKVDLGIEFNPESGKELYLVVPDQSEVRTLKKLSVSFEILRKKPYSLSGYYNINDIYTNRENLSNIHSGGQSWGLNFNAGNHFLPTQLTYSDRRWHETEVATGRTFRMKQTNIGAKINKSFTTFDKTELSVFRNLYDREDFNAAITSNVSDNLNIVNNLYFDRKQKVLLTSFLNGIDQRGNDAFRRLQLFESLFIPLGKNLHLRSEYHYYRYSIRQTNQNQNTVNIALYYKLFQSLTTSLRGEYDHIRQTFYLEKNPRLKADVNYTKQLPLDGRLTLNYAYQWQRLNHTSDPVPVLTSREEHALHDGQMELLNKAWVDHSTVIVKDVTGTIIFQPVFDYILVSRNQYTEIRRVPGGQIPDGTVVYVDYTSVQPGNHAYSAVFQNFHAGIGFWKRLAEVYFTYSEQDYDHVEMSEYLTLNYFTRKIYGVRSEFGIFSAGAEYEDYKSSLIPYKLFSCNLQLHGMLKNDISYSLSGYYRSYDMLSLSPDQTYYDVTGSLNWFLTPLSSLRLEAGYRKQAGTGIDLDLITARTEFTTTLRQLLVKINLQVYRRDYLSEVTDFFSGSIQIIRKFNWTRQ